MKDNKTIFYLILSVILTFLIVSFVVNLPRFFKTIPPIQNGKGELQRSESRVFNISKQAKVDIFIKTSALKLEIKGINDSFIKVKNEGKSPLPVYFDFKTNTLRIEEKDFDASQEERKIYLLVPYEAINILSINGGVNEAEVYFREVKGEKLILKGSAGNIYLKVEEKSEFSNIEITTGVGNLTLEDFSKLDFKNLNIITGVGNLSLDLKGNVYSYKEISIKKGIGKVAIKISKNVPAKIELKGAVLNRKGLEDFYEERAGVFVNRAYKEEKRERILIKIEGFLGELYIKED